MYVAGYSFQLLNNAFTNHWGLQSIKTRPKWRAVQQSLNNRKFNKFAMELIAKYGRDPYGMAAKLKRHTKVTCGPHEEKIVVPSQEPANNATVQEASKNATAEVNSSDKTS